MENLKNELALNQSSHSRVSSERNRKIVLIAIEGTWRNSRRMVENTIINWERLDVRDEIASIVTQKVGVS